MLNTITLESFQKNWWQEIISPIQDVCVFFLIKLHEANDFSEQPIVVSSVIIELRNEQHPYETSEVDKGKKLLLHSTGFY